MEIRIVGKPIALCNVDMRKFKVSFKQTLNLKDSLKENFKIIDKGKFEEIALFKWVHLGLNWGRIIDIMNEINKDTMKIRFFKCEYKNKVEFTPDLVSEDGRYFIFKQEVKSGIDLLMVNSFMNNPDFDMHSYLNATTFNYGMVRWKPMIDFNLKPKSI